ncbi:hypothetical protein BgiMline_025132 [Biomphalaria glabrata]|nr:hypothetical protein BgiMline_031766 [Biomphalaria glabrata]KAI8781276.1 hypothetical protein BgiBS90_018627 [Biomphalaria glabrata]
MSRIQSSKSEYSGTVGKAAANHCNHSKFVRSSIDHDINNGSCVDPEEKEHSNGEDAKEGGKTKSEVDLADLFNSTGIEFHKVKDSYDPNVIRALKHDFFNKIQKNGRRTTRSVNRKVVDDSSDQAPADGQLMTKKEFMDNFIRAYGSPVD